MGILIVKYAQIYKQMYKRIKHSELESSEIISKCKTSVQWHCACKRVKASNLQLSKFYLKNSDSTLGHTSACRKAHTCTGQYRKKSEKFLYLSCSVLFEMAISVFE